MMSNIAYLVEVETVGYDYAYEFVGITLTPEEAVDMAVKVLDTLWTNHPAIIYEIELGKMYDYTFDKPKQVRKVYRREVEYGDYDFEDDE